MRVPHVRADRYPCQSEPDDRYHPISAYSPCGTIPRRQGWPAKARNIRAFAMAIIEVLPRRLRERIEQLGAIGRDPAGGLTRLPFAPAHVEALQRSAQMMREAGLDAGVDEFGNLIGRRAGRRDAALLAGSHLDTVPQGGIFDGALGVVAAIECAQVLHDAGRPLQHSLVVMAFADEEGHAFGVGTMSSRALVAERGRAVGTIGRVHVQPGATNVIPGRVDLTVELRSPEAKVLETLRGAVEDRAHKIAGLHGLKMTWGTWDHSPPVPLDPRVRDAVVGAIERCGHPPLTLPSWAGHDAGVLSRYVPAGMIFVVSTGGLSHSPDERTPWDAVATGAQVLLETLLLLDEA